MGDMVFHSHPRGEGCTAECGPLLWEFEDTLPDGTPRVLRVRPTKALKDAALAGFIRLNISKGVRKGHDDAVQ